MAKKMLIVSTSAGSMGGNPTGLWLAELAEPWFVFGEAGYEITLASPAGGAIPIDAGSMAEGFFTDDAKKFMLDAKAVGALCHRCVAGAQPCSSTCSHYTLAAGLTMQKSIFTCCGLTRSVKLSEVGLGDFDAMFIAGGHGCC